MGSPEIACVRSPECFHSTIHRPSKPSIGDDPQSLAAGLTFDFKPVAGQRLARGDTAKLQCEIGDADEASGLFVKVGNLEDPTGRLAAGMLAGDAVEPALDAAGQPKIGRIDGEDERAVDDAAIEPVGQDELHALDLALARPALLPFIDPGELMPAPVLVLADRGADRCRL